MEQADRSFTHFVCTQIVTYIVIYMGCLCISSQCVYCSAFKYLSAVCSSQTLHIPQLHLYRSAKGLFHVLYVQQCHVQYVLTVASLSSNNQHTVVSKSEK